MSPRAALAGVAGVLWASAVAAQPALVPARAFLGRFGTLAVTVCPGDLPPEAWRQRIREEFGDRTFTLYEPSPETAAIHADLRVVLRAARCAEGAETYELFMTDGRGEAAQSTMLRMEGVARDDRPQVAALRVAEVFRTHRSELVAPDRPMPVVVAPPREDAFRVWDMEVGGGARSVPSSDLWLTGLHIGFGLRPTAESAHRWRLELGADGTWWSAPRWRGGVRAWLALGWTHSLWRSRRVEVAAGGRVELAGTTLDAWRFPTVILGGTVEVHLRVIEHTRLWTRLDVGAYALGAQGMASTGVINLSEGFSAALTMGVRVDL